MSGITDRIRTVVTRVEGNPRILAVLAVAVVLLVVIALFWVRSGNDQDDADASALEAGASGEQDESGSPGGAHGESDGSISGSGADDGSSRSGDRSDGSGGPGNQGPVIANPGLSSDGMLLRIAPIVTDPEDDEITLLFDVDGTEVDPLITCYEHPTCKGEELPNASPTKASAVLDPAEVGYTYEVPVTIIATDSQGATTRADFTHVVRSHSTVSVSAVTFKLNNPNECVDRDPDWLAVRITRQLGGSIEHEANEEVPFERYRNPATGFTTYPGDPVTMLRMQTKVVTGEDPTVAVHVRTDLLNFFGSFEFTNVHRQSDEVTHRRNHEGCEVEVSYGVTIDTR